MSVLLLLFVAWFILMPLDAVRFEWSDVPVRLQVLGAHGIALSFYGMYVVYRENAYLYPVVKLQEDRGQSVVTTGPHRHVRHPLYSFALVFFPATALLRGSGLDLLYSSALIALMVLRTVLEDRMLRRGLVGYTAYAQSVRYRLVPRVW